MYRVAHTEMYRVAHTEMYRVAHTQTRRITRGENMRDEQWERDKARMPKEMREALGDLSRVQAMNIVDARITYLMAKEEAERREREVAALERLARGRLPWGGVSVVGFSVGFVLGIGESQIQVQPLEARVAQLERVPRQTQSLPESGSTQQQAKSLDPSTEPRSQPEAHFQKPSAALGVAVRLSP